jgi:hypothetical protein
VSDTTSIKEIVEKVEKSINDLTEQMRQTRVAIEQLAENMTQQTDQTINQAKRMVKEVHQEFETFKEQRHLVESQLTSEVDRAKQLSGLKDLEDAVRVIIEMVDEIGKQIDLEAVVETVSEFESKYKHQKE